MNKTVRHIENLRSKVKELKEIEEKVSRQVNSLYQLHLEKKKKQ